MANVFEKIPAKEKYESCELLNRDFDFSYEKALNNLKDDTIDDFTKVFSIISLDELKNKEDTKILFNHLTDKPNPIREITAVKIEELSKNFNNLYLNEDLKNTFLKGVTDINPNVSRALCTIFSNDKRFGDFLEKDLILKIENLLLEIDEINLTDKKSHAKNKKIFSLYWLLEALSYCITNKNNSKIIKILNKTITFQDYTIREKTAKILVNLDPIPEDLLNKIKTDSNFYVKFYVNYVKK